MASSTQTSATAPVFDFDYSEFVDGAQGMVDCTLDLGNGQLIGAHRLILGNSSLFFFNAFTSGMSEEKTRVVKVDVNPCDTFPLVLKWMYTGEISVPDEKIVPLVGICRYYEIDVLMQEVERHFAALEKSDAFPQQCLAFVRQCYELELQCALQFFVPIIAKNLNRFDMKDLSDNLDVDTFVAVLDAMNCDLELKVRKLGAFIGSYQPSDDELRSIKRLFVNSQPAERHMCKSHDIPWLKQLLE